MDHLLQPADVSITEGDYSEETRQMQVIPKL